MEEDFNERTAAWTEEEKEELKAQLERAEKGLAPKARGQPYLPSALMANLVLAWGCPPSKMVLADTRMIHDFFDCLRDRYDRKTLTVRFPDVLDTLLSEAGDACWEFWKSNELQPVKIFYEFNKVTDRHAVIFYNTQLDNKWQNLEGAEKRAKLKEIFLPLQMKNAKQTLEQAEKEFEEMSEEDMKFQADALVGPCIWPNAAK